MTEKVPVVLASDNNYAPFVATLAYSILENTKSFVEFYVLDSGISDNSKDKIRDSIKKFDNFSIKYIDTTGCELDRFSGTHCKNTGVYARYFIPKLLSDKDKVLYLDVDIIFKGDVLELYGQDVEDYPFGAVMEDYAAEYYTHYESEIHPNHKGPHTFFNSGVILFNVKKFNATNYLEQLIDKTIEMRNTVLWLDQDIMMLLFEDNYKVLDYKFNFQPCNFALLRRNYPQKAVKILQDIYLIHWSSPEKPWRGPVEFAEEFWEVVQKTPFFEQIKAMKRKAKYARVAGYYLFGFIPVFEVLVKANKRIYRVLRIPVLKSVTTSEHSFNNYGL